MLGCTGIFANYVVLFGLELWFRFFCATVLANCQQHIICIMSSFQIWQFIKYIATVGTRCLQIKRSHIRKGMVMLSPSLDPIACWEFEGEILVLHHPTTISVKYQAMGESIKYL